MKPAIVTLSLFFTGCLAVTSTPVRAAAQAASPVVAARQLVLVTTSGWNTTSGELRRYERASPSAEWQQVGQPVAVVIGRTGLAWGDSSLASAVGQPVKREGDGRSPAGAFPLDTAFGFSPASEMPWLRLPYARLNAGSDCVDDTQSMYYNTVVDRAAVQKVDWTSAEHMRQINVYRIGVIVGYNAAPPTRGRGSCIFLHIWGGPASTTAGCTALDAGALENMMRWLDRSRRPMIVQLPASELDRLGGAWKLPKV